MKRRNRKRGSKAAKPAKIPIDAEKAVGSSTALAGAGRQTHPGDEFIAPVEAKESGSDPTALPGADYVIDLGDEFAAAVEEERPAGPSVVLAEADHHTHPGNEFKATVEVVAAESGTRIQTRLRDLSQKGCYVDTNSPFPLETAAEIRITKGAQSFEARARVVFSQVSKGMGLVFTGIEREQLGTLETWIGESRETSWLAANRRRSQLVLMKIPVRVSGQTGPGSLF